MINAHMPVRVSNPFNVLAPLLLLLSKSFYLTRFTTGAKWLARLRAWRGAYFAYISFFFGAPFARQGAV
jgi:hypothetical protein